MKKALARLSVKQPPPNRYGLDKNIVQVKILLCESNGLDPTVSELLGFSDKRHEHQPQSSHYSIYYE